MTNLMRILFIPRLSKFLLIVSGTCLILILLLNLLPVGMSEEHPTHYKLGQHPKISFNLVSWDSTGKVDSLTWENIVQEIYDAGIRNFTIITYRFVDKETANISKTSLHNLAPPPENSEIASAIKKGKELGMGVSLNPFLEIDNSKGIGSEWRGNLYFSEAKLKTFFKNYKNYIKEMAQLAQAGDIDRLYVGSELKALTLNPEARDLWNDLINETRNVFKNKGILTYAANHDNYKNVPFWSELDEIGIDVYFSLATKPQAVGLGKPSVDTIKDNWKKLFEPIRNFSKAQKKPVIFSEWGSVPFDLTSHQPWNWKPSEIVDTKEQINAYKATIEALDGQGYWLQGIEFWHWAMPGSEGSNYRITLNSEVWQLISRFILEQHS